MIAMENVFLFFMACGMNSLRWGVLVSLISILSGYSGENFGLVDVERTFFKFGNILV